MNITHATPGDTITLSLSVVDDETPSNNPVTGLPVTCAIRRTSDDKYYNWVTSAWTYYASYALAINAGLNIYRVSISDQGDGTYQIDWDQSVADASATRNYVIIYEVTGASYPRIERDLWMFDTAAIVLTDLTKGVKIQVTDSLGDAIENVKVEVKNSANTASVGIQYTNSLGFTPYTFGLSYSTTYKVTLTGGGQHTFSNPYTITTSGLEEEETEILAAL